MSRFPVPFAVAFAALMAFHPALPAQDVQPATPAVTPQGEVPLYQVTVVGRDVTAVNYHQLTGSTPVDLRGTSLLPPALGHASVEVKDGATHIHVNFEKVNPAQRFGAEYLTYVLWAITPEGHPANLGEVQLRGQSAVLDAATPLQNFALIVTAEPYFAVSRPSDVVVMENFAKEDTVGSLATVHARAELIQRGQYRLHGNPDEVAELPQDPKVPLDLYEAQNAVRIARWAGAADTAPEVYRKAQLQLQEAESDESAQAGADAVATAARAAVETAEDARLLTLQREQDRAMAAAQANSEAANAQAASAQAAALASAAQTADAEAQRQAAEQQAEAAQRQAQAANEQAAAANQQRAEAENNARLDLAREREARNRLLGQLNAVLATRDSAGGLIMNMSGVLFATDQYNLTPEAEIKLAKVSGILVAYPDLKVQINGYTDNTGDAASNVKLSEERANSVRAFLIAQGVDPASIQAAGLGEANPAASNDSAQGRQQNRRVEMIVNGASIGNETPGGGA